MNNVNNRIRILNDYVLIYKPEYHRAMKSSGYKGFVYEHIFVLEKELGRHIEDDECVHHLNGIRSDNRPENLILLSRSHHSRLHVWLKEYLSGESPFGIRVNSGKSKICTICGKETDSNTSYYCSVECRTKASEHLKINNRCAICGLTISPRHRTCSKTCAGVYRKQHRKVVDRPSNKTILEMLKTKSMEEIARNLGVSSNSIRKWLRSWQP